MKTAYKCILENAIDFLVHSVIPPIDTDQELDAEVNGKYTVLNLSAAVELFIKARLCKEHWSLVFSNIDRASKNAFYSGRFVSVDFDQGYKRLTGIVGQGFTACEKKEFDELRRIRNIYQHLRNDDSTYVVYTLSAKILGTLIDFHRRYFEDDDVSEAIKNKLNILRKKLRELTQFREERLKKISNRLIKYKGTKRIELCPECEQSTLVLGENVECLYCNWRGTALDIAKQIFYLENGKREESLTQPTLWGILPMPETSITICKSCGKKTVIVRYLPERSVLETKCYSCAKAINSGTMKRAINDLHSELMKQYNH